MEQSDWITGEFKDVWFSRNFYEAIIKYYLFLGQPRLHPHGALPMGHMACLFQNQSANNPSRFCYLHQFTKSIQHFTERRKLPMLEDEQEFQRNQVQPED